MQLLAKVILASEEVFVESEAQVYFVPKVFNKIHVGLNAFGLISYPRFLAITIIGNTYSKSSTSIRGAHFTTKSPLPQIGKVSKETPLAPYLFVIFLETILWWLEKGHIGYKFNSPNDTKTEARADDLAILMNKIEHVQIPTR